MKTLFFLTFCFSFVSLIKSWNQDKILLSDVKVLTLTTNQMTNARRSSAVPQLKCVGGSAGCSAFLPYTVQCYNRGSDGYDIQWECKTDMDNEYRFGKVEVSCEGYDYPNDHYILKGSCGLEYTIDYTKEGHQKKNGYHHNYGYNQPHYHKQSSYNSHSHNSYFGTWFILGGIAVCIYVVYRYCLSTDINSTSYPQDEPPPYGFRPEFTNNSRHTYGQNHGSKYGNHNTHSTQGTSPFRGFWSGAATGGILGYLFGNRNTGYNQYNRPGNSWGNYGSSWGGSSSYQSGYSAPSAPTSSGTRTASGFGGTKRR